MVKLQMMKNGQYILTIPSRICKLKQWDKGQELDFNIDKHGQIVIVD